MNERVMLFILSQTLTHRRGQRHIQCVPPRCINTDEGLLCDSWCVVDGPILPICAGLRQLGFTQLDVNDLSGAKDPIFKILDIVSGLQH